MFLRQNFEMRFLALLFVVLYGLIWSLGGGWFISLLTAFLLSLLAAISTAISKIGRNILVQMLLFLAVFGTLPLVLMKVMARSSDMTKRVGGRDLFVDGMLTQQGGVAIVVQFMIMGFVIFAIKVVLKRAFGPRGV